VAGDPPGESVTGPLSDGPPRALIIAAVAIAVIVLGAILAIAASHRIPIAPVAIAAVSVPGAQTRECQTLLNALPDSLGGLPRAATAEPTPAGTAAWRGDGEPVILRCGLGRPAEFVVGAPIQVVNDVEWFQIDDAAIIGKAEAGAVAGVKGEQFHGDFSSRAGRTPAASFDCND